MMTKTAALETEKVTIWKGIDPAGQVHDWSWEQLKSWIFENSVPCEDESENTKKSSPSFACVEFDGGRRLRSNVRGAYWACVLDLDEVIDPALVLHKLEDYEYIAWTTWKNEEHAPRWRVVLPLKRNVDHNGMIECVHHWAKELEGAAVVDTKTSTDRARLWFAPWHRASVGKAHRVWENTGKTFSRSRVIRVDFTGVSLANKPETVVEGERNTSLAHYLRSSAAAQCQSDGELTALARAWNARLEAPLNKGEVDAVVRSAWKWWQTREGAQARIAALPPSVDARSQGAPPFSWTDATYQAEDDVDWTWYEFYPESGIVVIYGPSGEGKTAFTIASVAHIALGRTWYGKEIDSPSPIAYIAAENPKSVRRRFAAWAMANGVSRGELDSLIKVGSGKFDLNSEERLAGLQATIPELTESVGGRPPRVWVVDTLAAGMTGDENTKDIQDAVLNIRTTVQAGIGRQPLIIFVHHTGKDESKDERGHSSLRAAVDTSIKITAGASSGEKPTRESPRVLLRRGMLEIKKQRDGVDGGRYAFKLEAHFMGCDKKNRPRSQLVCSESEDIDAAAQAVAEKRSGSYTKPKTDVEVTGELFTTMEREGGPVFFRDLAAAVCDMQGKTLTENYIKNFDKKLSPNGLESRAPARGERAVVTRKMVDK